MNALSWDTGQILKRFVEQHCGIIQQLYSQLNADRSDARIGLGSPRRASKLRRFLFPGTPSSQTDLIV
jgi:hypothetical protein